MFFFFLFKAVFLFKAIDVPKCIDGESISESQG